MRVTTVILLTFAACASRPAPPPAEPATPPSPPVTAVEPEREPEPPPRPLPPPPPDASGRTYESWANGAVFYEVFVRSFRDSDGDGKGDLEGLIARLDYLNDGDPATGEDLGVDALWLMPVFESPSYHGYDTVDYENIDREYGSNADFRRLAREARKRGMRIVVDLVLNHSSVEHPWFVESARSPRSKRRDYYTWSPTDPGWGQPWNPSGRSWHEKNGAWYYGVFWSGMPDLNYRSRAVRAHAVRIARLWLDRGVDGFRLDATRHLFENGPGDGQSDQPETHVFLKEFAAALRTSHPRAVLIGENWTDTPVIAKYFGDTAAVPGGDELPLNFDFPLAGRIIGAARQGEASVVAGKIAEMQQSYPPGATWVPFLTNHDMKRVASELGNDPGKLRVAAAVMLTLPGTPFLYYGEEVGMQNGPGNQDEWKRTPMPWTAEGGFTDGGRPWRDFAPGRETANVAAQTGDPGSLLSHYRRLIRARKASPALRRGRLELLTVEGPVLAYLLARDGETALVAHNLSATEATAALPRGLEGARLHWGDGRLEAARVTLPPHGGSVWIAP
jgi:glycosidase